MNFYVVETTKSNQQFMKAFITLIFHCGSPEFWETAVWRCWDDGPKMFLFTIVCVSSIDFMRQCFCDVFVLVSFGSHAKRELEMGRKHLQVSSEVQYACWKHMSNKIKGWRGRICCANVLGARFFGSIVDFPFCLPDTWFNLSSVSLPWEDGNQNSRPFLIISEQTKTRFVMECKNIYCNFNWTGSVHSRFTLGLRCKLEERNPNPATVNRPTLTIHPTWPALTLGNKYCTWSVQIKRLMGICCSSPAAAAARDIFRGAWKGADRI